MNTSEQPMYTNSDCYPEGQTEDALFPSIIDSAKGGGATNVGELYCAEAVQCQEAIAPVEAAAAKANLPLQYTAEIAATAPNYTAQCVAAQQAHITALFIADIAVVASRVAQDCSNQGYHPLYVIDGEDLDGAFATTSGLKDPGLRTKTSIYNDFAVGGWVAGLELAAAGKAGGLGAGGTTPTSAELVKGLNSLKGETLDEMAPPLTFTDGTAHPADCWFTAGPA